MVALSQVAFLIVILIAWQSCDACFRSSRRNKDIANRNYPDSPIQRKVATAFGDEIPNMRDDLIKRKNNGEGPVERHLKAWTTGDNWKIDPKNDENERNDPAVPDE